MIFVHGIPSYLRHIVFSLVDLRTAHLRSQRHLWISTCPSHGHFPFHTCCPLPPFPCVPLPACVSLPLRKSSTRPAPLPSHLPDFGILIEVHRAGISTLPPPVASPLSLRVQNVSKPRSVMDDLMSDFWGPLTRKCTSSTTTARIPPPRPYPLPWSRRGCGIAVNRSRMRGIETTIHPFGHGGMVSHLGIIDPLRSRVRAGLISR